MPWSSSDRSLHPSLLAHCATCTTICAWLGCRDDWVPGLGKAAACLCTYNKQNPPHDSSLVLVAWSRGQTMRAITTAEALQIGTFFSLFMRCNFVSSKLRRPFDKAPIITIRYMSLSYMHKKTQMSCQIYPSHAPNCLPLSAQAISANLERPRFREWTPGECQWLSLLLPQ